MWWSRSQPAWWRLWLRSGPRGGAGTSLPKPLAPEAAQCGFPSPAQDYPTDELDLTAHLICDCVATYIWRVAGHSMEPVVPDGAMLIVDRGIAPTPGKIVVAIVDGEYTVKRLNVVDEGHVTMQAENPSYPDIELPELSEMMIWGVVTYIISPAA
ncbi:S24 family peptidase [Dermabacter vaginalis]|uniref:LexA family protein n=1 Tax=Dermabacter vaginalis TaxID=1630135 RepID=UPI0021A43604|nr:S24 family peptidase [Dermabacter vaginalis]MCT2149823.1 S24 family peptidase [Dermabacter vaginalis]